MYNVLTLHSSLLLPAILSDLNAAGFPGCLWKYSTLQSDVNVQQSTIHCTKLV